MSDGGEVPVEDGDLGQSGSDGDPVINSGTRSERHSASTSNRLNSLHSRRNLPTKPQRSLRRRASSLHSHGRDRRSLRSRGP
jgi:hypothetical protein